MMDIKIRKIIAFVGLLVLVLTAIALILGYVDFKVIEQVVRIICLFALIKFIIWAIKTLKS